MNGVQVHDALSAEERQPAGESERIYWMRLVVLLAKRSRLILGTVLVATALAAGAVLLLPDMYSARTVILPPQQTQSALPAIMGQISSLAGLAGRDLGVKSPADLYAAILQGETIGTELVQQFQLLRVYGAKRLVDARKKLAGRSNIGVRTKEGLIDITVEDSDPKRAASIANAYVDRLFQANERLALTEASQRRQFFEREIAKSRAALARVEEEMRRTQETTGVLQVDAQARGIIEGIAGLSSQIAAKEIELRAVRTYATEKNPNLVVLEEELAGLKTQLAKAKAQGGGDGDPLIATRRIPQTTLQYARALRDLKYQETLFELLVKQYEAARIDEAKSAPLVQVIDAATVPEKRSGPHRTLIVAGIALLSFLLAALYAVSSEAYRRYVADPRHAADVLMARSALRGGSRGPGAR